MPWRDSLRPEPMTRVAVVAPRSRMRRVLVAVADAGTVELEEASDLTAEADPEQARLRRMVAPAGVVARLAPEPADLGQLERLGRQDLIAGEASLSVRRAASVTRKEVEAVAGWTPATEVDNLAETVAPHGGGVVSLRPPRGVDTPTVSERPGLVGSLHPLVDTYATVPYADVDPTLFAALTFVVMFGMMFGDVGDGLLLVGAGLALRLGRPSVIARFRRAWPIVVAAGFFSTVFGFLYGEFFGPTGVIPVLWLSPLDEPLTLLVAALGVGAFLLAVSYLIGTVNRWREGGVSFALYSTSGIAGLCLYSGGAAIAAGLYWHTGWPLALGVAVAVIGLVLAFSGSLFRAGSGAVGVAQASVESFDTVVRLGANLLSFARLAAFGLTHAALSMVVWNGTTALWGRGPGGAVGAVLIFVVGSALAFLIEALVAGVQALRLEYYELFSRIFSDEGRRFRPWRVPTAGSEE